MKSKFIMSLLWSVILVGSFTAIHAQGTAKDEHPELSPEEKLMTCRDCHREATPDIYKEWFNSRHGIDNVRCFQCHGTFDDFHKTPPITKCAACHTKEVKNLHIPEDSPAKTCWACHPVHKFRVHGGK